MIVMKRSAPSRSSLNRAFAIPFKVNRYSSIELLILILKESTPWQKKRMSQRKPYSLGAGVIIIHLAAYIPDLARLYMTSFFNRIPHTGFPRDRKNQFIQHTKHRYKNRKN